MAALKARLHAAFVKAVGKPVAEYRQVSIFGVAVSSFVEAADAVLDHIIGRKMIAHFSVIIAVSPGKPSELDRACSRYQNSSVQALFCERPHR